MSVFSNPPDEDIMRILRDVKTVALVGASANPERPSYRVMKFLQGVGYKVIPVNPGQDIVLGEKTYATLAEVPDKIDMVDVFRRAEATPDIAREASAIRAKVFWLQLDIVNDEAAAIAEAGGMQVVMDRCTAIEHRRLL